jgi:bacterioferritin B
MPDQSFADALNKQIANEFSASQQYIAAAVYYDAETMPQFASFFYRQAVEERNHAMIMVQYLLDTEQEVRIPAVEGPETTFGDIVGPVSMALEQEKRVTDEINELFGLARENGDYQAEQFLLWFVKEQVEEVRTMTDLLHVAERAKDDPLHGEEYLARQGVGEDQADPTTPPAAGGAL